MKQGGSGASTSAQAWARLGATLSTLDLCSPAPRRLHSMMDASSSCERESSFTSRRCPTTAGSLAMSLTFRCIFLAPKITRRKVNSSADYADWRRLLCQGTLRSNLRNLWTIVRVLRFERVLVFARCGYYARPPL